MCGSIVAASLLLENTGNTAPLSFLIVSLLHLCPRKGSLTVLRASGLYAWKPLSPGPSPHYHTHSVVTTLGSSSSASSRRSRGCRSLWHLCPSSLLPPAGLAPLPTGRALFWTLHVTVICTCVLPLWADAKFLENTDEISLISVPFAWLPSLALHLNVETVSLKLVELNRSELHWLDCVLSLSQIWAGLWAFCLTWYWRRVLDLEWENLEPDCRQPAPWLPRTSLSSSAN